MAFIFRGNKHLILRKQSQTMCIKSYTVIFNSDRMIPSEVEVNLITTLTWFMIVMYKSEARVFVRRSSLICTFCIYVCVMFIIIVFICQKLCSRSNYSYRQTLLICETVTCNGYY